MNDATLSVTEPYLFAENNALSFVSHNTVFSCLSLAQESDLLFVKYLRWHLNGSRTGFSNSIPVLMRCTIPQIQRFMSTNNGSFKRLYICSAVTRHFVNL